MRQNELKQVILHLLSKKQIPTELSTYFIPQIKVKEFSF